MKKLLIALAGVLTLGATLPAFAGPDLQEIERARKAKRAAQLAHHRDAESPATTNRQGCPPPPLVLPLDHGPRAQTTPDQNRLRRERFAAQLKECANPAK